MAAASLSHRRQPDYQVTMPAHIKAHIGDAVTVHIKTYAHKLVRKDEMSCAKSFARGDWGVIP
jgi:hypothetical protein